ncbi:MAG TPA: metalloregulator ArsR/SmtB family transcription factor, partial [Thermomicrobiales bacterium]|nr:metalloregulator ArsR/SmtB family transcription factor [Thermomicrobiales bacterium]
DDDICDDGVIHVDAVIAACSQMIDTDRVRILTTLFGAISDPNRLRIVTALQANELCVCDIAATVGLSESAVSHHLRTLREAGLVRNRRDGRRVWYAVDDEHISGILQPAIEHATHRLAENDL